MSLKEIFRKNKGILGINERNVGHIYPENPRKLLKLVDDKLTTKKLLKSANIPFPEVYGVFRAVQEVKNLDKVLKIEIERHCLEILEGVYSLDGRPSPVYFESLIISHTSLDKVSFEGVPDVRIIVYRGVPVMAMVRLPTKASSGKANLHKGALGAGIKISEGRTVHAICKDIPVHLHQDTGSPLIGVEIPF